MGWRVVDQRWVDDRRQVVNRRWVVDRRWVDVLVSLEDLRSETDRDIVTSPETPWVCLRTGRTRLDRYV